MVAPAARRRGVEYLMTVNQFSQRRACRLVNLSRAVMHYKCRPKNERHLRERLKVLAERYPRYGYLLLHGLLKQEGLVVNRKRTYRLYTGMGLQVRTKKRKKLVRPRIPMAVPSRPNERWSLDFVSDQLSDGRRFRILNIVDDYSRECVHQVIDTSISGERVTRELNSLGQLPKTIVCDNGTEFTSKAMFFWSQRTGVKLHFIQPGKPTQNAFVESFNARFRDSCLNHHWFHTLADARVLIEQWQHHYNHVRPHSSLGYLPPVVFAKQAA